MALLPDLLHDTKISTFQSFRASNPLKVERGLGVEGWVDKSRRAAGIPRCSIPHPHSGGHASPGQQSR